MNIIAMRLATHFLMVYNEGNFVFSAASRRSWQPWSTELPLRMTSSSVSHDITQTSLLVTCGGYRYITGVLKTLTPSMDNNNDLNREVHVELPTAGCDSALGASGLVLVP